jgi:hypothetical protein
MTNAYFLYLCSPGERSPSVGIESDGYLCFYESEKNFFRTLGLYIEENTTYDSGQLADIINILLCVTENQFHRFINRVEEYDWDVFIKHLEMFTTFYRYGYILKVY